MMKTNTLRRMKGIVAGLLALTVLTGSAAGTLSVSAEGDYGKLSADVIAEIEKDAESIPVSLYFFLSDEKNAQLLHSKQEAEAARQQIVESIQELMDELREGWSQVVSGEMPQESYEALLEKNAAAMRAKDTDYHKALYEQEAKAVIEEEFRSKFSALGIAEEMHCTEVGSAAAGVDTELVFGVMSGTLSPEQILTLSEAAEVDSFYLEPAAAEAQKPTRTVPEYVPGDLDNDKNVNASDAARLLYYAAQHGADAFSASFAAYMGHQEPFIRQTDKFFYYSTTPYHLEDFEGVDDEYLFDHHGTERLWIPETDANFLVTGIYQKKGSPMEKTYTVVEVNSYYASEPCYLEFWQYVPGGSSLQIGDLISLKNCAIVETYPGQIHCGPLLDYTNYGSACKLLGEEFRDVMQHEMILSQYYIVCRNEHLKMLPAPEEIGDYTALMTESHDLYGDHNRDSAVNASDAAVMLIYAAEYGADTFQGTFEEYLSR